MGTEIFRQREKEFDVLRGSKNTYYNRISVIRVLTFIVFLGLAIFSINNGGYTLTGVLIFVFPFLFGSIIKHHNRIRFERNQLGFLSLINKQESDRIEGNLSPFDEGTEFSNELHAYSHDLDVFGRNSIFQLLSRASTPSGRTALARWLLQSTSNSEIIKRQVACQELAEKLDWRQQFQALGMHESLVKHNYERLINWLDEPTLLKNTGLFRLISFLIPILTLSCMVLSLTTSLSIYFFFGMLAVNGIILKGFLEKVTEITNETTSSVNLLKSYSRLTAHIEKSDFDSEFLKDRKHFFYSAHYSAAKAIAQIQHILDFLNSRANLFYALLNLVFMVDIHLVLSTQKWKANNAAHVSKWFEAIGDIEAISSMAAFAFANKGYTYPVLAQTNYCYEAKELGQPINFCE